MPRGSNTKEGHRFRWLNGTEGVCVYCGLRIERRDGFVYHVGDQEVRLAPKCPKTPPYRKDLKPPKRRTKERMKEWIKKQQ